MRVRDLLGRLKSGKIPAVTVLFGDERWFVDQAIREIREAFLEEDGEGFLSFDTPRGDPAPLAEAMDEARTVPMFGSRKVVLLRAPSLGDEEVALVARLAKAAPPFGRFVLVLSTLGKKAQKALAKAGAAIGESKKLFDTPWPGKPEFDTELNKWTASRARERGKRMTLRTAHFLTGLVGNEPGALDAALVKLSLAAGESPEIDEEQVRSLIGGGRDFNAFALGEAVYSGDAREAYRVVRNAFREGIEDQRGRRVHRAGVVAGRLLWSLQFRLKSVYEARRLLDEGRPEQEILATMGTGKRNPALIRAVAQARRTSLGTLREHYVLISDAEAELRTPVPEEVIIEVLVAKLTGDGDG